MTDITVAVTTFGDEKWRQLAEMRAVPSAQRQGCPVIQVHSDTLQNARNEALGQIESEFIVYLDADDELMPGYIEAMRTSQADIRVPVVSYVRDGNQGPTGMPRVASHTHDCTPECLPQGNWIVIGACARTQLLRDIGGWWNEPIYEDWSVWLRAHLAGATFEVVPAAVYKAYVRIASRNRHLPMPDRNVIHHEILDSIYDRGGPYGR